jgi:hypothetical protein
VSSASLGKYKIGSHYSDDDRDNGFGDSIAGFNLLPDIGTKVVALTVCPILHTVARNA